MSLDKDAIFKNFVIPNKLEMTKHQVPYYCTYKWLDKWNNSNDIDGISLWTPNLAIT